jgi:hypothetical protein
MRGVDDLDQLLAELAADAAVVIEHEPIAQAARDRIRANLPKARRRGVGPTELERLIQGIFVERTISRWTANDVPGGDQRSERPRVARRKRPGAPPSS